jgi:prepilin-type N-terminal cleavage/methylation domain-containing protein
MRTKTQNALCRQDTKTLRNCKKKTWCLGAFVAAREGMTLPEMTVVIAIAALMVGLTVPAVNMLLNSFESESGAKSIINAALTSARAIAVKEQRYAGIHFQKRYDPDNPNPLNAPQYIIFIIQDPDVSAYGFRAVSGVQPIKLPDSIGVMDLTLVQRVYSGINLVITESAINNNGQFNNIRNLFDTTTFQIVFSPSGKLVVHEIRVRNRDAKGDYASYSESMDDIFNKKAKVDSNLAMFYQDDYFNDKNTPYPGLDLGLGPEFSRNSFIIYETKKLKQVYNNGNAWDGYLNRIADKPIFINPYTGTIINEK